MGCQAGNQSSHRRSFRVRNDRPEWENTDRPVMRSTLCNILAEGSGPRGECGWPVTNHFEGTGVALGAQLTEGMCITKLTIAEVAFSIEFHRLKKASTHRNVLVHFASDPTFR